MLSLADPWVGFWLPLGLVCLSAGFWLTDREDLRRRLCLPFFLTAAVLLVLHGAKTQGGDAVETALLAVLLDMAGPVGLMAVGTLIATFAGPSPVGPLPRGLRPFGFLMAIGGLFWIGWMLIAEPPGARAHGIGETIWGAWVLVFLSCVILVSAMAGSFCVMMGDARHKEGLALAGLSVVSGAMFVNIIREGSTGLDPAGWHDIYWQEISFIFGGLLGLILAGIAFIGLVYIAEKSAPDPDVVAPLSEAEKAVVDAVLREHLGIGGEE